MGHYPELLVLHVFVPDEDGDFYSFLHEDDGLTLEFKRGAYLRTDLHVARCGSTLAVSAKTTGRGFPEFRRRSLRLLLHGFSGSELIFDGRTLRVENGCVEFENSGQDFSLTLTLKDLVHSRPLRAGQVLQE